MKKYFFVLILLIGFKSFAQESKVESEKFTVTEKAEFPGGDEAFTKEFLKMIHGYIDLRNMRSMVSLLFFSMSIRKERLRILRFYLK